MRARSCGRSEWRWARSTGRAAWAGELRERKVSAVISRRSRAGRTCAEGPVTASQAIFIWGRAEILERPLRVKVRTAVLAAKVLRGAESKGKSRKTSSTIKARLCFLQRELRRVSSSGWTYEPVGLLGWTRRMARVRGVIAFSRDWKSMNQPWA